MSNDDKVNVRVSIRARWMGGGVTEMTRKEYDELSAKLDARPRGFAAEQLAEEIMDVSGITLRDGDIEDWEVDDFYIEEQQATP